MGGKSSSHWPLTLTNGATALLTVFLPLVLVRILQPDQVGRYQIFFLYVSLSPGLFLIAGLSSGLYHWAGKYPASKREIQQSWTLLVTICLALAALGLAVSHWFAPMLHVPRLDLRLFLVAVPFSLAALFLEDMLIARGNIWTGALYASGFNFVRATSILAAAWWTRSVEGIFSVFIATVVLRVVVGCFLFGPSGEIRFLFSREGTSNVLRYALPVSLAGLGALALNSVDQMILSWRLIPAQFAVYYIGCLSLPPLDIFQTSVNRVLIPRLSKAFTEEDRAESVALFSESFDELFRFLLPATVGLIIYAVPIIRILFTDRYIAAAHFLRIYAVLFVLWSCPWDAVARGRGDGRWILRTSLIFAILCIPVTWLAAGRWNAMGALIAMLSCQFLMRAYSLVYSRRSLGCTFAELLPVSGMLLQIGLVLVTMCISLSLRPLFTDSRLWFFLTGPLFALIYLGGTYALSLRQLYATVGPVRVLELTSSLSLGGLERMVASLSRMLNRHVRFKLVVVTYDHPAGQPSLAPQLLEAGVRVIEWNKGKGFSFQSVWRLLRIILLERTRVLHVHDLGPLIYGSLAKVVSLGGIRLYPTIHTLLDIERNPRYRLYYRIFLRFADRVVAVSPGVQAGLLELGVPAPSIEVIENGASFPKTLTIETGTTDHRRMRERLYPGLTAERYDLRWLLCLARVHPGKGQELVLKVWAALPVEVRAQLMLFIVGQETRTGYLEILRDQISALPDSDHIIVAGPSDRPEDWLQSCDIFISGSAHEGMPLAPLEAAGAGLPVLLSAIEGHQFLQPWAETFDPQRPEMGAQKLEQLLHTLSADAFQKRWQAAAPLRERWGLSSMTAAYAQLFQSK